MAFTLALATLAQGLRSRLRWPTLVNRAHPEPAARGDPELVARTEEFNRAAEAYWQDVTAEPAGRRHALGKPLTTAQEAAGILYRLGLVLSELDLGPGQTVLDLGAGSCWLSAWLNRLRCRTIAVDVSPTALALGRELFRLDPRQRLDLEPQFLPYDGRRIPVADASVDRVVCFDSFHHVPNQDAILAEIVRVLAPGGRAVFAEPGEGHAHQAQSLFEARRCGVLENDLELRALFEKARRAGFTAVRVKPYPDPAAVALDAARYLRFADGDDRPFPLQAVRDSLRHFSVFTLQKGEPLLDSRNPRTLRAEIVVLGGVRAVHGAGGAPIRLPVRVTNRGDTLWLYEETSVGGYVMLGGHLERLEPPGAPARRGFLHAALPGPVAPGASVDLEVAFDLPAERGRHLLRLDMVDEGIAWFEQQGSPVTQLEVVVDAHADSRRPHRLGARVEALGPSHLSVPRPGARIAILLRLTNSGDTIWLPATEDGSGAVAIGGHLHDGEGRLRSWDFFRTPLPHAVAPGASVVVECRLRGPDAPGSYLLRVDLVAERLLWFEHHDATTPFALTLDVADAPTDSREPATLRAELRVAPPWRTLVVPAGSVTRVPLRVVNRGATLWLHEMERGERAGRVGLGGRLRSATRALVVEDLFRTALPADVGPGEGVGVDAVFQAPATPGHYVLELDMVDEGIVWFAAWGSPTTEVTLVCT